MRRMLATMLVLVSGLLCQCILAQKPVQRTRLGGYVHDKAGEAWVGAHVHLVSRPLPGNEWIGEADRIVVQSGRRGRFAAKVLPGRDYLIWAVSSPVEHRYRSTHPLIGVRSGPVRLRERSTMLVQVNIRVLLEKHWLRPIHAKVTGAPSLLALGDQRVGDPHEVFPLALDEHGAGQLPLLPWKDVTVEIYDKRGLQLWAPTVVLSLKARKAVLEATPNAETRNTDMVETVTSVTESELRLPKPKERSLKVLDGGGLPLVDAALCQRIRGRLVFVSKTNAAGIVTTQLPTRYESHWDRIFGLRGSSRLVIRKKGYAEHFAESYSAGSGRTASVLGSKSKREIRLKKHEAHSGRMLLAPGRPLANTPLILYVRGNGQVPKPILLTTDKDGRYGFNQAIDKAWLLVAVLDDATCRFMSTGSNIPVSPIAILGASGGKTLTTDAAIDLSQLRRIQFALTRSDGGPASFANIDCFRISGFNAILPLVQMRVDRRGKLAMLINNCNQMLVVAQDEQGYAGRMVKDCRDKTELVLGGMLQLSGVLRDKKGIPAPGATIGVDSTFLFRFTNRINKEIQGGALGLHFGFHMSHKFTTKSDEDGRFSIWVPNGAETLPLSLSLPATESKTTRTIEMDGSSKRGVELIID